MKLISWNVNGLRACVGKGFKEAFAQLDADFFCLQETKRSLQPGQDARGVYEPAPQRDQAHLMAVAGRMAIVSIMAGTSLW